MDHAPSAARRPGRTQLALLAVGGLIAAVATSALLVWLVFFSTVAPAAADMETSLAVLQTSPAQAGAAATADPTSAPAASAGTTESTESSPTDGTWTIDPTIGSFDDYTSAWVGFRVAEVLDNIGQTEAVGRTPSVTGTITLLGTQLTEATFVVDLTTIESDQSRRDPAIQRALDTGTWPTATFVLAEPVDLGAIPADGGTVTVTASGLLSILGVEQPVEVQLQAALVDDVVVIVGSLPVTFSDYGVEMPTAPIVVSVEDEGTLEWQLYLRRAA